MTANLGQKETSRFDTLTYARYLMGSQLILLTVKRITTAKAGEDVLPEERNQLGIGRGRI